jgi:hypothetical protein
MVIRLLAVGLVCVSLSAEVRAEAVVLSSTAPGMTVGRVIDDAEVLHLPEDTHTALLLSTGQVVKLAGPYDGPPKPEPGRGGSVLAGWSGVDLSALGGARGEVGAAPDLPPAGAPVVVDIAQPGTWCVPAGSPVVLSLPPPGTVEVEDARSHARARLEGAQQPWPAALPLADATTLLVHGPGGAYPVRLRVVDTGPGNGTVERVLRFATAGCQRQVAAVLQRMGDAVEPFALFLSTDRGRTPRYAIGEPMTLVAQANRPAELYCWVLQAARAASLFPPPGHLAVPDHTELRIPGERVAIELAAAPPPGLGEVRCYAVRGPGPGPGPIAGEPSAASLDQAFAAIPDDRLARARVLLRIE